MKIPTPTSSSPLLSSELFSKISSGSSRSPLQRQFPSTSQTPVSAAFTLQDQAQDDGLNRPEPGGWSDHLTVYLCYIFITNLCSSGHSNINWRAEARRTETSRSTEVGGDISENRFDKFATMFIFYYNKFWLSVKILEISRPSCPLPNYCTVTCVVTNKIQQT